MQLLKECVCVCACVFQVTGVFSKEYIPQGTRFGPLQGVVYTKDNVPKMADRKYFWRVRTTNTHARTRTQTHTHIDLDGHTHAHTRVYSHTHTHTHTHTWTRTPTSTYILAHAKRYNLRFAEYQHNHILYSNFVITNSMCVRVFINLCV